MANRTLNIKYTDAKGWRVVGDNGKEMPAASSRLKFAGKHDGAGDPGAITFHIVGSPGVTFAKADPWQVEQVDGPALADQFTADPRGFGTTKLTVMNKNQATSESDYYYTLAFQGAPPLDPIITNGCCRAPTAYSALMVGLAAVAVIVAAAALFTLARRRAVAR